MDIIKHVYKWKGQLKKRVKTNYIILHHTGAKTGTVEGIHQYHRDSRGWTGIGYNYVIYKDGTIHEGRGLEYVGAHATDYNSISVGISCVGDFNTEKMGKAQYDSLVWLIGFIKGYYPNAKILGHKEVGNTACPGKYYPLEDMKNFESIKKVDKENNDMERYKTLADVPESYKPTIQKLMQEGVIKGKSGGIIDLTEDMCRTLVFVERMLNKEVK